MLKYDNFTVIDFETASRKCRSACALGIAVLNGNEIVHSYSFLFQPPENYYEPSNIAIHRITPDQTADKEPFPAVWEQISHLFQNTYVAAHNAQFDMEVLKAVLDFYGLKQPDFCYFDTQHFHGNNGRRLEDCCAYYNIPLFNHHDAGCDAEATAKILLEALKRSRYRSLKTLIQPQQLKNYADVKIKEEVKIPTYRTHRESVKSKLKEIAATTEEEEIKDEDFRGKTFVFTGFVFDIEDNYSHIVLANGGTVKSNVSSKVDFLVTGPNPGPAKIKKARGLQAKGHWIRIITEEQFKRMLESKEAIDL